MVFKQGMFQIDANMTPDQVANKRAMIAALLPKFGSAKYVGEGVGQLATGVMAGRQGRKLDEIEGKGTASANDLFSRIFGTANSAQSPDMGPLTVLGMKPEATAYSSDPVAPDPSTPAGLGDAAMAALGKPAQHDHGAAHPGQTHGEWLKYSNQSAVRDDPLDAKLVDAMSFVGDMGITMDVISGGQDGIGTPGAKRKGSTRHDHGQSADVDFYKDGRRLDWNNPDDLPVLQEIVRTAKSRGVTGIGAGDDYMGPGRFHVGFGTPSVWGANGKRANAPSWLVEAYEGAPAGSAPVATPTQGTAAPSPTSAPTIPINELYMALQNPWLSTEQKGLITSMIQEQQQASDPLRQLELQKAQLELQQMQNPGNQTPEELTTRMALADAANLERGTPEYQTYLLTGELPEPAKGTPAPMTPEQRKMWGIPDSDTTPYFLNEKGEPEKVGGGGVTVNNNMGEDKFAEAFAKGDADTLKSVGDAGLAAARNIGRIDQLATILQQTPTGMAASWQQWAGEFGINTEGLDDIQSAQAIINSLVPEQRQPGSGPMSDADLDLFKQSLPRIINQPGGNEMIIGTMKAIAQYDAEGAEIVQRLRNGEMTRAEAFAALKNRANPLAAFKPPAGKTKTTEDGWTVLPNGVKVRVKQ